jgi:hypothetical protein
VLDDDVTDDVLRSWVAGLDALFARVAGRFGRVEPWTAPGLVETWFSLLADLVVS